MNADFERYQRDRLGTLADFLTKYAENVANNDVSFDYETEESVFTKTFEVLNKALGKDAFSKEGKRSEQFDAFHYEAISVATASIIDRLDINKHYSQIKKNILELKQDTSFKEATENKKQKRTSGSDYLTFLNKRISIATQFVKKSF